MIRYFGILLFLLWNADCVIGQSHFIQTGFNKSNVSWHNTVQHNFNYDYNYFAGYSFEKPLNDNFHFNAALLYSQKGFVDRAGDLEVGKETYEYIDFIPTISFLPHPSFGFFIGGNSGVLLRDEMELAYDVIDLGLVMGVEYNFKKLKVRASYNHGISSIFDESINQALVENKISPFNSNFQLSFGYLFFKNSSNTKDDSILPNEESIKNIELGFRFNSLNSFNAIIKTQKSESQYIRYSLAVSNLTIERTTKYNFDWNLSFAAGIENRKLIDENIEFVHGLEPGFDIDFSSNSVDFDIGVRPYIGYIFGAYFQTKNDRFRFGIETAPRFYVDFDFNEQGVVNEWKTGLNITSRVGLVLTYILKR